MVQWVALFLSLLTVGIARAQGDLCSPLQVAKIVAADGDTEDLFGISGGLSGNVAVIGAWADDENGHWSGSAYIFRFDGSGWIQEAKLLPDDGSPEDRFGFTTSVDENIAAVGAYLDDDHGDNSGAVYIYRLTGVGWVQEAKLVPSDATAQALFGASVSVSGDLVVVGAVFGDGAASRAGSAYVFRYNGMSWVEEAKLIASDGAEQDWFGISVSAHNGVIVIGANQDSPMGARSGSAYIYRLQGNTWVQESKLIASDGYSFDSFGRSVSIDGDMAVVGAHLEDDNGTDSGSAYVFRFDGSSWNQDGKLISLDGAPEDRFGESVSIRGDVIAVGAVGDDTWGADAGSAYLFRRSKSGWVQVAKYYSADITSGDSFGYPVCLSGDQILVGGYNNDDMGVDSGSAYIFDLNCELPCLADTNGDGVVSPADFSAWVAAFNAMSPACDQNGDGACSPADFSAWVSNYNAGC